MKNVLKKIGICIVILIAIVIILGANFASDQLIQKVEDAHRVALSEKRYVKAVALGFVASKGQRAITMPMIPLAPNLPSAKFRI